MSPSTDVETGLMVDTTSFNGKLPVGGNVHSACGQATATPTPRRLDKPESVELPKMASPSLDTPQTSLGTKHATETTSLADRLARLQMKDEDEKESADSIGSQVSVPSEASSRSLGTSSDSGSLDEGNCAANQEVLLSDGEALNPISGNQQLLASVEEEVPEGTPTGASSPPEVWWDPEVKPEGPVCDDSEKSANEIRGLVKPTGGSSTSGNSGTETPFLAEEKDRCPPAPPPSPADAIQKPKADFEEFFQIRPSKLGGLGAFAVRELKKGEVILVERPLLRSTHFRFMMDYCNLSDEAKQAFLSLHGADGDRFSRVERIKRFNAFAVPGGIAIFEIASRFNHACPPARNVQYVFDNELGVMELTVCEDVVPPGAELHISYGGTPIELYQTYGFRCFCGGCTPLTDEEIRRLEEREFGIWKPASREYGNSDW